MDSVRFGRALGFGARSAAKAITLAVDAATSPPPPPVNPAPRSPVQPAPSPPSESRPETLAVRSAAEPISRAKKHVQHTAQHLSRGGKHFGASVWSPVRRLSGVLWLEMTGAFFGIFALFAGQAFWSHRADLHSTTLHPDARRNAIVFLAMTLVFGYFSISSFVRAHRRDRSR